MKLAKRLLFLLAIILPTIATGAQQTMNYRQVAVDYIVAEYGSQANGMKETASGTQRGLIATVLNPQSKDKAMYWVIVEEVTPVAMGKPQPDKKWKRISVLGIAGPKYGGWDFTWRREVSDHEFRALSNVKSTSDVLVRETIIQTLFKDKILPEQAREWRDGQFFIRATEAHFFAFDFETKVSKGGNLMGISVFVDQDGSVITKSESMMHVD